MSKPSFRLVTLLLTAIPALVTGCGVEPADSPVDMSENIVGTGCEETAAIPQGGMAAFFSPFDQPEKHALCVLSEAQHEVVVAHYNIRSERMLDKLVELRQRGVQVKVAVDQANAAYDYNTGDDFLESNGIQVVRTKPEGDTSIMHLKVAVIDGATVMTGSFNWNNTAAFVNDENMLVIRDSRVAEKYRTQVLEVLGEKPREVGGGQVTPEIEVRYIPEEMADYTIRREIDAAKQSVDVAMFTFTMYQASDALIRAVRRGVKVRLVVERKQTDLSTVDDKVEAAGAMVVRAANRLGAHSAMHQKYAVIDGARVITGATNWTFSGCRKNEEDLLVVTNPDIAARYRNNFADLLYVYAGIDDGSERDGEAGVVFRTIHSNTQWGDSVVAVGNHPALGNWNPYLGLPLITDDMFPNWVGVTKLPAGTEVEFKFVVIKAWGELQWEQGPNRRLTLSPNGRAAVVSGNYGDTSKTWTPRDEP